MILGHRNNHKYKTVENEIMELKNEIKTLKEATSYTSKAERRNKSEIEWMKKNIMVNNKTTSNFVSRMAKTRTDIARLKFLTNFDLAIIVIVFISFVLNILTS